MCYVNSLTPCRIDATLPIAKKFVTVDCRRYSEDENSCSKFVGIQTLLPKWTKYSEQSFVAGFCPT